MGLSNECRLRGEITLRDGVSMSADEVCEVVFRPFDCSPDFEGDAVRPGVYHFEIEFYGYGGHRSDRVEELVEALRPIVEPCVLEFVDTEMSADCADATMLYPVGQNKDEEQRAMLGHALDYLRSEYGSALPLIGGKPVWTVVLEMAKAPAAQTDDQAAKLREVLELGPSVEHTPFSGMPCTCSLCTFVRARREVLAQGQPL